MYKRQIVDSPNSSFWQAVYDCAQEWAQKNDAILEPVSYTHLDVYKRQIQMASDESGIDVKLFGQVEEGSSVKASLFNKTGLYKGDLIGRISMVHCTRKGVSFVA